MNKAKPSPPRRWNPLGRERVGCEVEFRVLSGAHLSKLNAMFTRDEKREFCLKNGAGVHESYVHTAFGQRESRFAVVAVAPQKQRRLRGSPNVPAPKGKGYALCSTYNSFGGKGSVSPVAERIVMIDLLCSTNKCYGLTKALVRAVVNVARDKYKATVLMLESIPTAATFYEKFGFRRVPNACTWPSFEALQRAKRAFLDRTWTRADDPTWEEPSPRQAASTVNKGVAPVWWPGYNSEENGTLIMSFCLGKPLPYAARGLVNWTNRTAAQLMAAGIHTNMAPTYNADFILDGSRYVRPGRPKKAKNKESTPAVNNTRRVTRSQSPKPKTPEAVAVGAAKRIVMAGKTGKTRPKPPRRKIKGINY